MSAKSPTSLIPLQLNIAMCSSSAECNVDGGPGGSVFLFLVNESKALLEAVFAFPLYLLEYEC